LTHLDKLQEEHKICHHGEEGCHSASNSTRFKIWPGQNGPKTSQLEKITLTWHSGLLW